MYSGTQTRLQKADRFRKIRCPLAKHGKIEKLESFQNFHTCWLGVYLCPMGLIDAEFCNISNKPSLTTSLGGGVEV